MADVEKYKPNNKWLLIVVFLVDTIQTFILEVIAATSLPSSNCTNATLSANGTLCPPALVAARVAVAFYVIIGLIITVIPLLVVVCYRCCSKKMCRVGCELIKSIGKQYWYVFFGSVLYYYGDNVCKLVDLYSNLLGQCNENCRRYWRVSGVIALFLFIRIDKGPNNDKGPDEGLKKVPDEGADKDPESLDKKPESPDKNPESTDKKPESPDKKPESPDKSPESLDKKPESPDKDPDKSLTKNWWKTTTPMLIQLVSLDVFYSTFIEFAQMHMISTSTMFCRGPDIALVVAAMLITLGYAGYTIYWSCKFDGKEPSIEYKWAVRVCGVVTWFTFGVYLLADNALPLDFRLCSVPVDDMAAVIKCLHSVRSVLSILCTIIFSVIAVIFLANTYEKKLQGIISYAQSLIKLCID